MLNYYWNCTNLIHAARVSQKCRQLDSEITRGKLVVQALSRQIDQNTQQMNDLHENIERLDAQVEDHKEMVVTLRDSFLDQEERIKDSIETLKAQVQRQCQVLQRQEIELRRMHKGKYTKDLAVDIAILILCSIGSRNKIVQTLLRVGLSPVELVLKKYNLLNRSKWKHIVEVGSFLTSIYLLRTWAFKHGMHHSVGSYPKYARDSILSVPKLFGI